MTVAAVLQHLQRMKLFDGTDGGTSPAAVLTAAPAGSEGGLVVRPVPSGTQTIQGQQSALQSGSIVAASTVVGPFTASNYNLATIGITGTYNGVAAMFEGSPDGTNWFSLQGQRTDTGVAEIGPGQVGGTLTNTTRAWDVFVGAWTQIRVRATAWTSGTATVLVVLQTLPTEPVPTVVQGPAGTAPWPTQLLSSTGTVTRPAALTTSNSTPLAANTNRRGASFYNEGVAVAYLKTGTVATATLYAIQVAPGGYWEVPYGYTSQVDGITASGTAQLLVTEYL